MAIHLTDPNHAYFFGFVQGDGHLSRQRDNPNKGKLTVELAVRDEDILLRFKALFPDSSIRHRTRDTNFKDNYTCATWTMCDQDFREDLEACGVPVGAKSLIIHPPVVPYSVVDYWRGIIDADGSLGVTAQDLPFLSLITTSEALARAYEAFLYSLTGKRKVVRRNTRDKAFNILLMREDAVCVIKVLYYAGCLALDRKLAKAVEAVAWTRPADMRTNSNNRAWTAREDQIVLALTPTEAQRRLGRSRSSVSCRRARLKAVLGA